MPFFYGLGAASALLYDLGYAAILWQYTSWLIFNIMPGVSHEGCVYALRGCAVGDLVKLVLRLSRLHLVSGVNHIAPTRLADGNINI